MRLMLRVDGMAGGIVCSGTERSGMEQPGAGLYSDPYSEVRFSMARTVRSGAIRHARACPGRSRRDGVAELFGAGPRTRHGRRCPCFHAKQGHLSTLLWSRQPGRFGRSDRGCLPFRNLSPAPPCGVSCGRSAGCVGVGYFIRSTYSRVRVSTRILSPVLMKSGTRIVAPVLTVAGLSELVEAVSPLIPGSV